MLVIGFEASIEAQITWGRVCRLLPVYWAAGGTVAGFVRSNWRQQLGTRVQMGVVDGMALADLARDMDHAMMRLRRCDVKAYNLAMGDIEEPGRPWHSPRHTGKGDLMDLTREEAKESFERAKECVHLQLDGGCTGCPFRRTG